MNIDNPVFGSALKLLLLIAIFSMFGCASGPPFLKVEGIPADKGLIYIYRPSTWHGQAIVPSVVINKLNAISIKMGGYYPYFSSPGEVTIAAIHTGRSAIKIDVKALETYYVRVNTMGLGIPKVASVTPEVGLQEVSKCKRLADVPGV
jgi:hypothetical protein